MRLMLITPVNGAAVPVTARAMNVSGDKLLITPCGSPAPIKRFATLDDVVLDEEAVVLIVVTTVLIEGLEIPVVAKDVADADVVVGVLADVTAVTDDTVEMVCALVVTEVQIVLVKVVLRHTSVGALSTV